MILDDILSQLHAQANPANVAGMARYGISTSNTLGVTIPVLREMAKPHRLDHALALQLWDTGIHEACLMATMVDDPKQVTEKQMERWVHAFDSWDICDQCCSNLFDKTSFAWDKAVEWCHRDEEFVRRAGFVMMAALSVHDKKATDESFLPFLALIEQGATDERNFVKKAVNWALRQIGKRNAHLRKVAMQTARRIQKQDSKAARWVAADALRELTKHEGD
jgi:3-methyladenine DNA glycosylase AlkD